MSSSAGRQPAVSGLADGTYIVVWDFAGDGRDVFAARFRAVLASSLEQKKLGRLGADDAA